VLKRKIIVSHFIFLLRQASEGVLKKNVSFKGKKISLTDCPVIKKNCFSQENFTDNPEETSATKCGPNKCPK
jgi:hypothetical protein